MGDRPTVTVLGGGHAAFITAADLGVRGFTVRILETPELAETIEPVAQSGSIQIDNPDLLGFPSGLAPHIAGDH